jgi:Protein of unknown function, DUF547
MQNMADRTILHQLSMLIPQNTNAVLNDGPAPTVEKIDEIVPQLKRAINRLKGMAFDVDKGRVNYPALANSTEYAEFVMQARALQQYNPWRMTDLMERMAFWINLYNVLIIHAVIAYGVRASVTEVAGIFDRAAYNVGGHRYSANDIEHGILRANAGTPFLPGQHFNTLDPRRPLCMPAIEPRIHFTLVCGALSCPPINVYDGAQMALQLKRAAENFINLGGGVRFDYDAKTLHLSSIFSWYAGDFGASLFGYWDGHQRGLCRSTSTIRNIANTCANIRKRSKFSLCATIGR